MKNLDLDKKIVQGRIEYIQELQDKLKEFKDLSFEEFDKGENFAVSAYYLRRSLEAVFDICAHILSRIPGAKKEKYKEMAAEMGKQKIIPLDYAKKKLFRMAGYRNRLTHFYYEITSKEVYNII